MEPVADEELLVGGRVAVSMLLLITAGLLLRGMARSRVATRGSIRIASMGWWRISARIRPRQCAAAQAAGTIGAGARIAARHRGSADAGHLDAADCRGGDHDRTLASRGSNLSRNRQNPLVPGEASQSPRSQNAASRDQRIGASLRPAADPLGQRFQLDMDFGDMAGSKLSAWPGMSVSPMRTS